MPSKPRHALTTPNLRLAAEKGLLAGPKTKHINAKVPPALFDAAAKRLGTTSASQVVAAALASIAVENDLGTWFAQNYGVLSDLPPEIMELIDI